jgi:hypothetical protein
MIASLQFRPHQRQRVALHGCCSRSFHQNLSLDKNECDLSIVSRRL